MSVNECVDYLDKTSFGVLSVCLEVLFFIRGVFSSEIPIVVYLVSEGRFSSFSSNGL